MVKKADIHRFYQTSSMPFHFGTIPFVRWTLPFAFGIIAVSEWGLAMDYAFLLTILLGLLLGVFELIPAISQRFTRQHYYGFVILPFWFFAGVTVTQSWSPLNAPEHYTHTISGENPGWLIRIESFPKAKAKSTKYDAQVLARADDLPTALRGQFILYAERGALTDSLKPGDIMYMHPPLRESEGPKNPGEFNYKKYLRYHGIFHQSYAKEADLTKVGFSEEGLPWQLWFEKIRQHLLVNLRPDQMSDRDFGVLAALVLGKKDLLDPEVFQSYSAAGAMHVLAVSGLHVGLFYVVVTWILMRIPFLSRTKWGVFVLVVCCLWLYAGVTGFSPSVTRAATMFSFIALAKTRQHRYSIYNVLAISALLILIIRPMMLFEVGFQLSYLAVLGIVYLAPMLQGLLAPPKFLWLDKIWALACVSFAAQAATFPLGLLYFHQFPSYFLFSNLFVIPAATLILYVGLAYLVVFWIPGLGDVVGNTLDTLVFLLNESVALVENLPGSKIEGISISVFEVYMVFGFMLTLVLFLTGKHRYWLFASLACLLAISVDESLEAHRLQRADLACFHSVNNRVALTLYRQGRGLFVCDQGLHLDRDKMTFHVGHFHDDLELRTPEIIDLSESDSLSFSGTDFLQIGPMIASGQTVVLVARSKPDLAYADLLPAGGILYLMGNEALRTYAKREDWRADIQMIINSQSRYYAPLLDSLAEARGVPIHNLARDGYLLARAR
jgi:competence protein ComEC